MKNWFVAALIGLALHTGFAATNDVIISEIMYHPFHTLAEAEDTGREWVELYNRGTNTVNLQGWRLTKGIEFTFTNITLVAPGEYIVVSANKTNFTATYPGVTNVVGNWAGRLSNTEDDIALLDPAGDEVNRVKYADSGDWAVRARASADAFGLRGWDWLAPHDGGGLSLELVSQVLPNHYGQNWSASVVSNGTPGAVNSVASTNIAPLVVNVSHFPLVPRSTETVAIKARVIDETTDGITVTLFYRNATTASPGAFTSLPMFDDGAHGDGLASDGVFGASVPAQPSGTVIEFYVAASDNEGRTRTWPGAARNAPDLGGGVLPPESGANAVYQVDDTIYNGTQPLYRLVMIESERAFLASIAGGTRNSDAAANGCFVSIDPNDTEVHQRASFRRRGAGSRSAAVPNYRVNFATEKRWKGVTAVNLNSQYPHAQVAGAVMSALSGLHAEFQKPVQVRVNGANLLGAQTINSYAQQEVPDGDYARNHFPDDPNGNLYRGSAGSHTATLAYLGTDPNSYINAGYSKTSNGSENDWTDLFNLTDVLNNTPPSNYVTAIRQRLNVDQWMVYFAVFALLDSQETSLGIGVGDDFGMYRGILDPRFQLLGHDFDTILGQGDTAGNVNDNIFRATAVAVVDRFLKTPEFAPIYFRTLTNLLYSTYTPQSVSAALNQHLGSWVPGGVISNMITFSGNRNAGVLAQIPLNITISHSLGISGGYPRTTTASVALNGTANAITTRSVRVNGSNAVWTAWQARWTATVPLTPGINRVTVQSLDENGVEFERNTLDVWYDTGTTVNVSGFLPDNTVWTAAGGPYQVTGNLVVPDGVMLQIQPGTTVYLAPGVTITVQDTGFIDAQGTESQHIRIGRNPAVSGNWGSIDLINNTWGSIFSYVDFDSGGGTTIGGHNAQIHVNSGSVVKFSHCTWPATPAVQYISFDASSFIVENCVFPTYPGPTGPEMLHGVNGIPVSGYGIFRDNYFGHTWGFNDTIDFTGGQRPGAILQIIGNIFDGATDDHLDLDSTDAWIEGNIFMHAHRDPARTDDARDTASAISGGVDNAGQFSEWTIINNLFYDVDHALLSKGSPSLPGAGRFIFVNNTLVHVAKEWGAGLTNDIAAFDFTDDGVPLPAPEFGAGGYVAHNIIWDAPMLTANYNASNHTLIFENNLLPSAWSGPGSNNVVADPRLNLSLITSITNADWKTVLAALTPRPGSLAIENGYGAKYDRGGLNPRGLLVFGEPRGTTTVNTATLTVAPGGTFNWGTNAYLWGYTHYKWKLDNGAWSAAVPITSQPAIALSNLSNGPHTVYVAGKNDAGYFQDDTFVYPTNASIPAHATVSRTWVVNTNLARLVINEVLAKNVSALNVDGKFPDAIELYNAGAAAVNLADMSLTDDPAQPRKFIFPPGTTIGAGQYFVVYAGSGESPGRIFTGFALSDTGEGVFLYDKIANGGALLDSIQFGLQLTDLSIGRVADGNTWSLTQPTFGSANLAQPLGQPSRLKINEWLAAAGAVFQYDFIELFNPEPLPVPLGGLALSDSPMSSPRKSVIPALSFIAANGWQSFVADGQGGSPQGPANHVNFKLASDGGWISLANTNGALIDMIVYVTQAPDYSQGRSPDGAYTILTFDQATPGGGNPGSVVTVNAITTTLVPLTQTWRMEASGTDLGTAWRANAYNDAAWVSGPALFYNYDGGGTQTPPIPTGTVVPFTNPKQTTIYFRTTINVTNPTAGAQFVLSHVIDDGAVLYLNNQEIWRYNFAAGTAISYNTRPASTISGAPALVTGVPITITNLLPGTNYLAIEVHQASATSSDIAMAIGLDMQRLVTNYLGTPIVLNEVFTKNTACTNAQGKVVDWVELYNPSTNSVDISDMSLTDDPARPRRWTFPPGATIPPSGYYAVEFDDSAPYTPFNGGFELSADSGAVYLFNRPSAGGSLIDSVVYGVQVADLTLGRAVAGLNTTWTLCNPTRGAANSPVALGSPGALLINEWMPNDANGGDDWFEIFNPAPQPIALGALHLTDNSGNTVKHTMRAYSYIGVGAEGYLKIIADNDTTKGADHVNFKLSNASGFIGIYTSNAVPTLINSITYTNSFSGISQGRLPDGTTNITYFTNSVSPEEANWMPLFNSVVINEAMTRPDGTLGITQQRIEIWNLAETDVAIGGWFLSNARKDLKRFRIPAGTIVPPGGFVVFTESQFNTNNDIPPSFALNATDDDEIYLSVADAGGNLNGLRTSVSFGPSATGISFGRFEKSTGSDFVALTAPTLSTNGPFLGTNTLPIVGPVIINEIMYHPPDNGTNDNVQDEFIELWNAGGSSVALFDAANPTNTWRLRDAVDFDFPTNTTIPGNSFVLVVSFDPNTNAAALAAFRSKYGLSPAVPIYGPYSGKLDNSSDSVELKRPDAPVAGRVPYILVERVKYSDSAPWPSAADGTTNGYSLQRRTTAYGNDPVNWVAGVPTPGAANGAAAGTPPNFLISPSNVATNAGSNVTFTSGATGAAPVTYQWYFNGVTILGATNTNFTVTNAQPSRAGRYSVIAANAFGAAQRSARLVVQAPPQIVQQPQSQNAVEGSSASFTVTASGGGLEYQWRFNGTNMPGRTSAALNLANLTTNDAGPYTVVVSNSLGSVTSSIATLTILVPPSISVQPQGQVVTAGSSVNFNVTASGTATLRYQWRFNNALLPNETNAMLAIPSAQTNHSGDYTVVITNAAGSVTSSIATLVVVVPPTVTVMATDANASEPGANTGTFTFTRSGDGAGALTANYNVTGSATPGSDYSALSGSVTFADGVLSTNVIVTPLNDAALEGDETVIVTLVSSTNYINGDPFTATVVIYDDDNAPPTISITSPTDNQMFLYTPTNVNITVNTTDPDGSVAKVEFFANGTNKLGESTVAPFNFTWTNAAVGTNVLTARASDTLGATALSAPVTIIVNASPSVAIVSPVDGATFGSGANVGINAFATDPDGSVTQVTFFANNVFVSAATNAPFTALLTNTTPGSYALRAVAFDNLGVTATSAVVTISVNQPGLFDDFEPDIDLAQWSAFGGTLGSTVIATNYGGSVSGARALWFGDEIQRFATTRGVNTAQGGIIAFQLRISNGGGQFWENADLPGEGVVLEYSVNGGSAWTTIATFDTPSAPYTQGWTPQQFGIPAAAQTSNTLFRWRQMSFSGACCDHWAIDDVQILVGPTPPTISSQPASQSTIVGGSALFSVTAFGSAPFAYQWRFFGTNLPNQTNATLSLTGVTTNQAGPYSVVVTNLYGSVTSSNALLTVFEANSEYFKILSLTANNVTTLDHYALTGYDPYTGWYGRGGLGVTGQQVFVNAGTNVARFSAMNLSGGVRVSPPVLYDALVTDLKREVVYCFGTSAVTPAGSTNQSRALTHLLELNANTGVLTGNAIPLSRPIVLRNNFGNYGFFSGYGCAVVWADREIWHVALPSGAVTLAGAQPNPAHGYGPIWAFYGIAETSEDGLSLVWVRSYQTVSRMYVNSGVTVTLGTFSNLGSYMNAISFSVARSRWYFSHMYSSQFSSGTQVLGFGDASFTLGAPVSSAPLIVVPPQPVQTVTNGRAAFAVTAVGDGLIGYQWLRDGAELGGATASSLVLSNVQAAQLGGYSVVVSNAFGSVTSAPVALTFAQPPVITNQPQAQTVMAGTPVTLSVGHSGDGPFIYQWRFNGYDIPNGTNQTYALNPAGFYDRGVYHVEVRNAVGFALSASAGLNVLSPPFFNAEAPGRQVLRGMNFLLAAAVDGTAPIALQWLKNGVAISGATSNVLSFTNAQAGDSGNYQLVATNVHGAVTSSVAAVEVLEWDDTSFAIASLTTNNYIITNIWGLVGYKDYAGLASSLQRVFVNGYGTSGTGPAGSYSAADLSGGVAVSGGGVRNGLVSDLKSRKVYCLADGTNLLGASGGYVTSLLELDPTTGAVLTNRVTLSTNNLYIGYASAVFSGFGRIVLMDSGNTVYDVALPSGQMTRLGTIPSWNYTYAEGFAYRGYGIAERVGTNTYLVHATDTQTMTRTHVPSGESEVLLQTTLMGNYPNVTVCLPRNRWYWDVGYSGTGQGGRNLASATATFIYRVPSNMPPTILEQPLSQFVRAGSNATLSVLADGGSPLLYQWRYQGAAVTNQTNATLTLTNVRANLAGDYTVVVSNLVGVVTSAVATITVDYGASTTNTVALLALTGVPWKYNQTAAFFNNSWVATNFNDSSWQTGNSGLAVETAAGLTPYIGTSLTLGRTSYYFRCYFNVTSNFPAGTLLRGTTLIDDGAVIYINGRELSPRIRMPSGTIGANTFATSQPSGGDAGFETFFWSATNLVVGTNVIAAEVHQNANTSSDIFWAMQLDALVPTPNQPPVITNHPISRVLSNGLNVTFAVGARGTAPLSYQWLHDGTNLPSATNTSLSITNLQRRDAGVYVARVMNPYDTALSSNATLTVLVPPIQFTPGGMTFSAPGTFQLKFTGDVGAVFSVEASTNLTTWAEVGRITNSSGAATFNDPTASGLPWQFYRLRLVQ